MVESVFTSYFQLPNVFIQLKHINCSKQIVTDCHVRKYAYHEDIYSTFHAIDSRNTYFK